MKLPRRPPVIAFPAVFSAPVAAVPSALMTAAPVDCFSDSSVG